MSGAAAMRGYGGADLGLRRTPARLALAVAASALLHFAVLAGVPVKPISGTAQGRSGVLYARLNAESEPIPVRAFGVFAAQPRLATAPDYKAEVTPDKAAPELEESIAQQATNSPPAGVEVPLIRDPTYYPAKQLDVYPTPLTRIELPYPETAGAERGGGKVTLLLLVDELGFVTQASVVEAEPPGYFEDTARTALRSVRFHPGMKNGRAVKSRILVQVRYYDPDASSAAVR